MDFVLQPLHRMALAHLINRLLFGINHIIFVFPSETWNVTVLPAIAFLKSIRFNDPLVGVCYSENFCIEEATAVKALSIILCYAEYLVYIYHFQSWQIKSISCCCLKSNHLLQRRLHGIVCTQRR